MSLTKFWSWIMNNQSCRLEVIKETIQLFVAKDSKVAGFDSNHYFV